MSLTSVLKGDLHMKNLLLNIIASWWAFFVEFKYISYAFEGGYRAGKCGYDRDTQRAYGCEDMGLAILKDVVTQEVRICSARELTLWEKFKLAHLGFRAGINLKTAGWTKERVERKVSQFIAEAQSEEVDHDEA